MAEIVPVRMRGLVFALNTSLLLLFTPSLLYSELIGSHTSWRWCFYICLCVPPVSVFPS
jgi:MFS family permease